MKAHTGHWKSATQGQTVTYSPILRASIWQVRFAHFCPQTVPKMLPLRQVEGDVLKLSNEMKKKNQQRVD